MNKARRAVLVSAVLGSMGAGGLLGATLFAPTAGSAATTSTTAPTGSTGAAETFHSNENSTHEKTESAQREADENSGKVHFGGGFHPNENSTHEKTESATRETQEKAGQMPTVP